MTKPAWIRPALVLVAAAAAGGVVVMGVVPFTLAAPVIGVVLALGAPLDHDGRTRSIAATRRNVVLAAGMLAALAVVVWQPQLIVPLVTLVGVDAVGLVSAVVAVVALALPLGMSEKSGDRATGSFVLTRRNLILSLAVVVSVATWYAEMGHSFLPVAVLVLALPLAIGCTRVVASRREELELGLHQNPLGPGLGPQRWQLLNVVVLCGLLALTVPAGAYSAFAVQLPGLYPVLLSLFFAGLLAFVVLALLPLRNVRAGSNFVVAAGTIFLVTQLVPVYQTPISPVTIGTPLAGEWWVGHGGHTELVNYHQTSPMQSNAVDIMRVGDGGVHRPGATDLTSYYIFDEPVLAPADGTVTYVVDGHPDQPIGSVDARHPTGNQVIVDIGGGRYLMMGHLRQGSIQVDVGQRVGEGQPIARVGNSGNSSAPHLHIQAQTLPIGITDIETVDLPQMLRTLQTFPLLFRGVHLLRNGVESRSAAVDPRRGDILRPARR